MNSGKWEENTSVKVSKIDLCPNAMPRNVIRTKAMSPKELLHVCKLGAALKSQVYPALASGSSAICLFSCIPEAHILN